MNGRKVWQSVLALGCAAALLCVSTQTHAIEQMDNAELLKLINAGVLLPVITSKFKVSDCHFLGTTDALVEIQKACTEAKWPAADITVLQNMVIDIAGRENKRLKELVDRALNVFLNADPVEYDLLMRTLMREGKAVVPYLLPKVDEESERERGGVVDALRRIGDKSEAVVRVAVSMLFDRSKPVRMQAARCVAELSSPATFEILSTKLKSKNEKLDGVALAIGYLNDPRGIPMLVDLLRYCADPDARVCAAVSLGELRAKTAPTVAALLETVLDERDDKLRLASAHALALVGERRAPSYIIRAFQRFRAGRDELLRELQYFNKDADGVEFLLTQLENDLPAIKKAALETLRLIAIEPGLESVEDWHAWWEIHKVRPDWVRGSGETGAKVPAPGDVPHPKKD